MAQVQEIFLFNPTSIAGCALWLDAADTTTISTTGATLNSWTDKASGIPFVPTNGTGITYSNSVVNLASTTFLKNSSGSINIPQSFTMFMIAANTTGSQSAAVYLSPNDGGQPGIYVEWPTPTNYRFLYRFPADIVGGNSVFIPAPGVLPPTIGTFYRIPSGGNYELGMAINGGTPGVTADTQSGPLGSSTQLAFGVLYNTGGYFRFLTGYYAEILFYRSQLTTNQRQQVEGYLAWKWNLQGNLPSNHPFKNARPSGAPYATVPPTITPLQGRLPFVPTQISGCSLWFDAADLTTFTPANPTNGQTVTAWRDKIFNITLTNQNVAPTYSNNGLLFTNPSNNISGSTQNLIYIGTTPINLTQNYTLFVAHAPNLFDVLRVAFTILAPNAFNVSNVFAAWVQASTAEGNTIGVFDSSTGWRQLQQWNYINTGAGNRRVDTLVSSANNVARTNATANSGLISDIGAGSNIAGSQNLTGIGISASSTFQGNRAYDGRIYEVILYNSTLPLATIQQVEGYLAWKWGFTANLPANTPFKNPPLAPFPSRALPFQGSLNSWQPTQISGNNFWFDASDPATVILSGTQMTQWNDKSGNNYHMSVVSGQSNTTVSQKFQNNLNVLNLTGLNLYRTPVNSAVYPFDCYVVLASKALAQTDFVGMGNTTSDNFNSLTLGEYTATRWHNGSSGFARTPDTVSPTNETSTGFLLMNWSLANNNYVIRRNTLTLSQTASYTYTMGGNPAFQIGYRHTDAPASLLNCDAYFAEIVVYNSQLGTQQRQRVEGYLAWKWGLVASLPANHPFKLWPPSP